MARDDPENDRFARVLPNGRISVPAAVRRRMGWEPGQRLWLEETEHGLVVRTTPQSVRVAQALYREALGGKPGGSVDDFLGERRAMWGED